MLEGCLDNVLELLKKRVKFVSRNFKACFQGYFRDVCETTNRMTMKNRMFVWDRSNNLCFHEHRFRDPFPTQILRTTVRYTLSALGPVLGAISH